MSHNCPECEQGLPEWVMSYADMITILMAFFVVMYSMAGNKDTSKEQAVLKSLRHQFGPMVPAWGSLIPPIGKRHQSSAIDLPYSGGTKETNKNRGGAEQKHGSEGDFARAHVPMPGEAARVGGVIYFAKDGRQLNAQQEQSLRIIAAELSGKPQKVEIRGHSARRNGNSQQELDDSWNLAYERALATMKYLTSLGINPERFRIGVAADNEPLADDGVAEQYAQNARVDVFLLNELGTAQRLPPKPQPTNQSASE